MNDAAVDVARWQAQRRELDLLAQRIVHAVIARECAGAARVSRVVEIGAGGGQLMHWLPPEMTGRTLHLDAQGHYLKELRRSSPGAAIAVADAHALPVASGRVGAVLGLCVFDVLADPPAAAREIRRVLAPGGVFIHLLDMATNLEPVLAAAVARHQVPLPNFLLGDESLAGPGLRARLTPLTDFLLLPHRTYAQCVQLVAAAGHMGAETLADWGMMFLPDRFVQRRAATMIVKILRDPGARASFLTVLRAIHLRLPLDLEPVESSRQFRSRMAAALEEGGMTIGFDDVVTAAEVRPNDADLPDECRYVGSWIGVVSQRREVPAPVGTPVAPGLERVTPAAGNHLLECGIHVCVARPA